MADPGIYAFSIRKSVPWRGDTQQFSNLYHYSIAAPTEAGLIEVLDKLKAVEVPVHGSNVTFVEGRAWGPVNPNGSGGRMEAVKLFSGTGSASASTGWYREWAILISWPLGRYGSKNRPQFLRKWLHCMTQTNTNTVGADGTTNLGGPTAQLTTYINAVTNLVPVVGQTPLDLKSASNHVPVAAAQLFPFLEHRQFGR